MPAVLAIDTSTDACSVAFSNGASCNYSHRLLPRAHNRHILPMIDEVLAGRALGDVDIFACGLGPGSFTGLRIAASVIQGLAWALDRPVVGFCSLEAQARTALSAPGIDGEWLLSATDAQIGQLYWRLFHVDQGQPIAVDDAAICRPTDLELPGYLTAVSVVGSGAALQADFSESLSQRAHQWLADTRPHARDMASHIALNNEQFPVLEPEQLAPRYVQQDIGWKKLSEQPRRD